MIDWTTARSRMMLDPTVTNLNTGSFGPLPHVVFDRATQLRSQLAAEPMDFLLRIQPPLLWEARTRLATFLNADPRRLMFAVNVTAAINIVSSSITLAAPGEILLTDHEYGAMHWTWERAARRLGLTIRTFPLPVLAESPETIVEAAKAAMTDRTRLFFFSHVLSPTGLVLPARELCKAARERGILTVVDGAHAPAFVPLDLEAINADFYGANLHKWLLAPTGSGFLYLAASSWNLIQPLQVSWGWRRDPGRGLDEPDEHGTTPRLRFLEFEGTRDLCPWLAIPAAIDFQTDIGFDAIRGRIAELVAYVRRRLGDELGLPFWTPANPAMHGALMTFRLPDGTDAPALRRNIWQKFRIEVPIIDRPGPGSEEKPYNLIRTSTHFYNTTEEVDRLVEALKVLL